MKKNNIHLRNLGILAAYMLILTAVFKEGVLVASIIPIAVQVVANFIYFISNFEKDRSLSYTYLLSAFLVLLIGFPSCWALSGASSALRF